MKSESGKPGGSGVPRRGTLHADWLVGEGGPFIDAPGRIALSSCPGRVDLGGDVDGDVRQLITLGIGVVVSLVSDAEMERYGVVGLRPALRDAGLHSLHYPLEDTHPPRDLAATQVLCRTLLGWLGEGTHVLIHCIGGWGRSGTLAASLLTHQGYEPAAAIALVRQARSPRCVESRGQERFVAEYARAQAKYTRYYYLARRDEVGVLLSGSVAARTLVRSELRAPLLDAATLPKAVQARSNEAELVIVSGERAESATASEHYAVDRAFSHDGQRWQVVPLRELAK